MADIETKNIVNEENNDVTSNTEKKAKKADKPKREKKHAISSFFKDLKGETKKITWYPKKQTFITSGLVIAVLAILTVVIGLIDTGLSSAITALGNLF